MIFLCVHSFYGVVLREGKGPLLSVGEEAHFIMSVIMMCFNLMQPLYDAPQGESSAFKNDVPLALLTQILSHQINVDL